MERFDCTVDEIRNRAGRVKDKLLGEIREGNPVIFGAGDCGHKIYDLMHGFAVNIWCFCDNGMAGNTDEETGLAILSPEEMRTEVENPAILICVGDGNACREICLQLSALGFDEAQIHMMNEYFYWQTGEYFETNIEKYRRAYQFLDDEFSRRVYLERMKKVFLLSDISEIVSPGEEEYFDGKVVLTDQETYIDCGGFDGDSSRKFIEQCKGRYREIIIFEPELCKQAAIEKTLGANHYKLYQSGVWSKNTKRYFNAMQTGSSHISEKKSEYMIETVALDEVVYDDAPTYIKMDVEGAEQEALKGCRRIIQDYRPKLAICIYHKPEDLFEIPAMIKEMNPEYKLYVRQYANAWYDTVLYAV